MVVESNGNQACDAEPFLEFAKPHGATAKPQNRAGLEKCECRGMRSAILADQLGELFGVRFAQLNGNQRRGVDNDQSNVPRSLYPRISSSVRGSRFGMFRARSMNASNAAFRAALSASIDCSFSAVA